MMPVLSPPSPTGTTNGTTGGYNGSYTVESIRPTDEIDTIYIEQGSGLKATRIQLWQGRRVTLTVVDDTGMNPPSPSTYVYIQDPLSGSSLQFRVIENGYNAARKVEGKRDITAEYLTLIEGIGTVPPA
jgi:hypothetical protein